MNTLESETLQPKLSAGPRFLPGATVKVCKGIFAGRIGTVVDQENPIGSTGVMLPKPHAGCYWIKLVLNRFDFTAHLHEDEIEMVAATTELPHF
jgi:hypothetical protein